MDVKNDVHLFCIYVRVSDLWMMMRICGDMLEYIVQWLCGSVESVSCAEYFLYLDLSKF